MESLERLAGSIAQVELLVASLKRENRDLAARLATAAAERRQALEAAHIQAQGLERELIEARAVVRQDPGLEARAHQAELESAELARRLDAASREHLEQKARLEALVRQLEAQVMADRGQEQLPVASAEALAEAREAQRSAEAGQQAAEQKGRALEAQLRELMSRLDGMADSEARAVQESESLKARLNEQEKRVTALETAGLDLERQLGEARLALSEAPKPEEVAAWRSRLAELEALARRSAEVQAKWDKLEQDQSELRRQKREVAGFAKERQALRRKVDELVSTLESVRLG